jgi:hypothetical protein
MARNRPAGQSLSSKISAGTATFGAIAAGVGTASKLGGAIAQGFESGDIRYV